MCDCFHLAFPNWHAASSGTGAGRRLRGPEPGTEGDSICDEPSQFTEGERPRPQGSSPVEEFPETEKYTDSDKEFEAEHDPHHKRGKKTKKSGFGSMFDKRSTPKMSKLKEVHSPESGVIVKTAKDGCAEGLIYGGGGKEGIFIKEVVPESPASKSLKLKQGDQILSATVYFDNVSYEDAIQILEHAQAYKVKLCLKRQPDITETEPAIESDVIPEEEPYAPEMREQEKTKRRGDARISWPKFPSFGKGRKSRFPRSHSSSEADEQRKLELSPTTSDTESPIKSQEALKGKKRHKMKLSVLTKRGRVSSSEEQDTEAPTTGQISGTDIVQTQEVSDMLSPDCLESPSRETPEAYGTEVLTIVEDSDLRLDQNHQKLTEPQTVQHKVELITIDSTLKTTDLSVALADQESPSGIKSPDGKKKKKEKSELKMKILGKDKHKKDAKAKSSPKRLKTLGASIEITDQPEKEKSDVIPGFETHTELQGDQLVLDTNTQILSSDSSRVISAKSLTTPMKISVPKVELDISDIALIQKSSQKGEEKTKKGKALKQKQETKTGPIFKLPKIGLSDIATEESIQKMNVNVEECSTNIKQLTTEGKDVKEDPYDKLSKSSISRTQLPKREDIEIPGMEDVSKRTTAKGIKAPKAVFTGPYEEIQAETVQMSIDVNSVKEAVSKLPGYKLPKVDMSGVPIPEEITVIDANAQRISVKTPTKVVDTKAKQEVYVTKFDVTASPEISKTSVKLPKIKPADLTSDERLSETKVEFKEYKAKQKQSDRDIKTGLNKREDIIIPGKESTEDVAMMSQLTAALSSKESDKKSKKAKIVMPSLGITKPDIRIPNIGIDLPKQNISEQKGDKVKEERTIFPQEVKMSETETGKDRRKIVGVMSDIKIPEIETSAMTAEGELQAPSHDIDYIDSVGGSTAKKDGGVRRFGVNLDAAKPKADISFPEIRSEVKDVEAEEYTIKLPKFGAVTPDISVNVPDAAKDINIDGAEIKTLEREGKGSKFKMPNIGISMPKVKGPKMDLSLSKRDVDVRLPEAPEVNVSVGKVDVSTPEQKMEVEKPELDIKPLQTEVELDGQGSKFKMPKLGIKMPKIKGPEFDVSLPKKDVDVTLPEAKAEVKLPEAPDVDVTLGGIDVSIPEEKVGVKKPELEIQPLQSEGELDGQGSKFKMPRFGIKMPKIKGPEFDLSLSKKDIDVPEATAEVKFPEAPKIDVTGGNIDVSIQQKMEVEKHQLEIKPLQVEGELDGQGGQFKMPKLGIAMPKVKGPETDISISKKDVEVTLSEAKAEVRLPDVELKETSAKVEIKAPEIKGAAKAVEGSPSKFKMPTFKLPKFGAATPNVSVEISDKSKDIQTPEKQLKTPKDGMTVGITAPNIDIEGPSLDVKTTAAELDGKGSKFKMPKFGISLPKVKGPEIDLSLSKKDVDITLPEAESEVKLPDVEHSEHGFKVEVKAPEIEIHQQDVEGSPSKFKMPTFKLPKFGGGTANISAEVPDIDKDVKIDGADIDIPEKGPAVDIATPSIDIEGPSIDIKTTGTEQDGKGSKFKMPKFGISMPKVKGPQIDLSLSKKDVDVTLPEAEAEVKLPEAPKIDVSLEKSDVCIPEKKLEVKKPELEMKPLQTEVELDGQGSKFKMPKLGMSMPKVKGPEIHLSKRDEDVTLPEATAEVKLPEVEQKEHSAKVVIKSPEKKISAKSTDGSPSKFKMPTFKLPKFGVGPPNISAEVPDIDKDVKIDGADIDIPGEMSVVDIATPSIDIEGPSIDMKTTVTEQDGKGSKFKMPHLSFSMPKAKGPKIDLSLSKKDVEITLPEAKADVKLPEAPKIDVNVGEVDVSIPEAKMEVKRPELEMQPLQTEGELEGQGDKFKMPKFGMSMPKIKGPEIHLGFSKKDVDVTLPEAKAEVNLPDVELQEPSANVEMKAPETEVAAKDTVGSPSKFKMPSFSFSMPKVKGPELSLSKKDTDIILPEANAEVKLPKAPTVDVSLGKANVLIPEVEVKKPELVTKPLQTDVELEGQGGKFKMPKFGITMPKVKGPEIDLSLSKKDVTLPDAKAEVELPGDPKIAADMKTPECEADIDAHGSKFKMPKFGITMPKVKGPETDLSFTKKDVDVSLPEAKAEVKLPDVELKEPSAKVEIKAPAVDVQTSSSKFKMPTFKLPKFGAATANVSVEVPDMDKEIKVEGGELKAPKDGAIVDIAAPNINIEGPSLDVKMTGTEGEGKESKFKMPKFGISLPKVQGPEIDLSLSKRDVEVTLPEAKAEVNLPDVELKQPSAKVEMKSPEIEAQLSSVKGSPSKFKLPTFKFPKFGAATPNVSVEEPDIDKEIKIDGADIQISVPQKDVDIPEVKPGIHLPEVEVKEPSGSVVMEHQPGVEADAKLKKSRFSLPGFSFSKPSVKAPEVDVSLQGVNAAIPGGKVEVKGGEVEVKGGEVDLKPPECEAEIDAHGSKFKMPKFGITMPKVTGPEIDLSFTKKDVDVTLPEAKAEVKLPEVEVKEPAEVEIKAPVIKEGSPSKFKMPTFKLPKFGVGTPSATVEVPDMDKDINIDGADVNIPEEVLAVNIAGASINTDDPSIDVKLAGIEHEGKGSKFKLPNLGFSAPQVKGPDIDLSLSKKDGDVTLPKAKAEVQLPDVEKPSAKVEIKAPGIDIQTSNVEGSPSKFKMPTFKLPKFGAATPQVSVEVPDLDKDIKVDGADLTLPEAKAEVKIPDVEIKELTGSVSVSQTLVTEGDAKLTKPSWTLPRFSFSKTSVKPLEADVNLDVPKVDVTLPEAKTDLPDINIKQSSGISIEEAPATDPDAKLKRSRFSLPKFSFSKQGTKEPEVNVSLPDVDVSLPEGNVKVKQPEVELKAPEGDAESDGQESKFKMPKFGISIPKVKGPEVDLSLSKKDVDVTLPEAEVQLPDVKMKQPSAKMEIKAPETEAQTGNVEGSASKLKMPTFTLPRFGVSTPKVSVEVPDVNKDEVKLEAPKAAVDVTAASIDTEGLSVDVTAKGSEHDGSGSKFKMPKFGISIPKVKGPEIDLSVSKKDVDVPLPEAEAEVKLPDVEVKEPEAAVSLPDAPVEVEAKLKRPNWTFPRFSFSRTGGKTPDADVNLETPKADVASPELKAEVCVPDVEVKGPSVDISMEEPPAAELDANLKKPKFSLPRFSFSKLSVKEPEVSADVPHADVSLAEGEIKVKQPEMEIKSPELEAEHDGQGSKFKLPKFGITLPKAKGPEADLNAPQKGVDVTLPEVKAEVKIPEAEAKEFPTIVEIETSETEAKSKDFGGSPLKFKMPTMKMPKFGGGSHDVTIETPELGKETETDGAKIKEDVTVDIKGPSVDIKTDASKVSVSDYETPKTETDSVGLASPSKFKLPSFKMPKLNFSRPKPEDEFVSVDTKCKDDQLEMEVEPKGESKSPKMTLTSFGEIFKNIDVEFDVSKTDKEEENLDTSKEVHGTAELKKQEAKGQETNTKQDTTKSPERTGWFKFPKFGLSSPSEPAKISEKDEHKDEKSPAGGTVDEEISPTCSVQSSDAFADISSAMTSEHVGLSLSSPTKVTVRYSDPNSAAGLGEMHTNIITSTTRTELISVEPNLPEKITILSSGVSSSSEDTLRLESGKIHVITSNIQATPEAQQANLLTAVQVQSAGGFPLKSEANEAASWTVESSQSGRRTVFEKHLVTSSESQETIVITKQITHIFDSAEPISDETATSIQRLRDSVHSDKMRFFDGAEK